MNETYKLLDMWLIKAITTTIEAMLIDTTIN